MLDPNRARERAELLLRDGRVLEAAEVLAAAGFGSDAAALLARLRLSQKTMSAVGSGAPVTVPSPGAVVGRPSTDRGSAQSLARRSISPAEASAAEPSVARSASSRSSDLRRIEEAAMSAEQGGDLARAGTLHLQAGNIGRAVQCYLAAGDRDRALAALLRIPRADAQYPRACALVIELACALDRLDFEVDQFLGPFLGGRPATEEQLVAFHRAASLFERHGLLEEAELALGRILQVAPDFQDAAERLAGLASHRRATAQHGAGSDAAFDPVPPRTEAVVDPADSEVFPSLPELRTSLGAGPTAGPSVASGHRPSPRSFEATTQPELAITKGAAPQPRASVGSSPAVALEVDAPPAPRVLRDLQPGTRLADRYEIRGLVGCGGMAAVYSAHDLELDEAVALKVFARADEDPNLFARFKQEVSLARQISHPNVIRLYDLGVHGPVRFITMELLSGRDLATIIESGRDLLRDLDYFIQACHGLGCVHDRGVVHRDLKPENLFVTVQGVVKLMDFGIAKRRTSGGRVTQHGFTAGTPAFMAPEQIESFASVTHLSDLYSLGIIGYALFTGTLPFDDESQVALLLKQLRDPAPPPSRYEPSIPAELEDLVLRLLEKDPSRRIQSCAELADRLESLRVGLLTGRRTSAAR